MLDTYRTEEEKQEYENYYAIWLTASVLGLIFALGGVIYSIYIIASGGEVKTPGDFLLVTGAAIGSIIALIATISYVQKGELQTSGDLIDKLIHDARVYYDERDFEKAHQQIERARGIVIKAKIKEVRPGFRHDYLAVIDLVARRCRRWLTILSFPRTSQEYKIAFNYEKKKDEEVIERLYPKALVERDKGIKDKEKRSNELQRLRGQKESLSTASYISWLENQIEMMDNKLLIPTSDKEAIIKTFFSEQRHDETLKIWKEQEYERKQPGNFDVLEDDLYAVLGIKQPSKPSLKDPIETAVEEAVRQVKQAEVVADKLRKIEQIKKQIQKDHPNNWQTIVDQLERELHKKGIIHDEEY